MTDYYISTMPDSDAQFRFNSIAHNKAYTVDDRTGFAVDDANQQVKISHLQANPDKYTVVPATTIVGTKIASDGSASSYYDFPPGALTLNDLLEFKGDKQWLGDSFHLSNIVKAAWRWGDKAGVDKAYDARKIVYSGCRLLMKLVGVGEVRKMLQSLLDDPQFQERK